MIGYLIATALLICTASAQLPDCSQGEYWPHPTDCAKYYQCSGGVAIEKECSPGLHWNVNLNACDFPSSAGCTVSSTTTPTTTTATTGTTSSSIPTEGSTTDDVVPSTETSVPTESSSIPTESSSIPTESSSIPTESSSIPTESSSPSIPTEGPTTDIPTESSSPTTTTQITPSTESPEHPNSCPPVDDPDVIIRLPHESLCNQYYICQNGTKISYACTLNNEFSVNRRFCFPPEEAGCSQCPSVDTESLVRLPHEFDCTIYYLCVNKLPELYRCRDELEFSRQWRECLTKAEAACTSAPTKSGYY